MKFRYRVKATKLEKKSSTGFKNYLVTPNQSDIFFKICVAFSGTKLIFENHKPVQIPIVITLLARKNRSNVQFVKQHLQPKTPCKHILIQFMMEKSWTPLVLSVQFVRKYSHPAVIFGLTFQTSTKMWWLKVDKSQKFFSF